MQYIIDRLHIQQTYNNTYYHIVLVNQILILHVKYVCTTSLYILLKRNGRRGSAVSKIQSSKYYERIHTAVARGLRLPAGRLASHQTAAASEHSFCYFRFIFRVDGHAHRRTFSKRNH